MLYSNITYTGRLSGRLQPCIDVRKRVFEDLQERCRDLNPRWVVNNANTVYWHAAMADRNLLAGKTTT